MAKEWRIGICGVGVVGEWHVRVINKIPGAKLVALCDLVPDKCRDALEKNGLQPVPIYSDLKEMLEKEQLDVINICTPTGIHLEPALMSMQAGKNVICEKPLEVNLERIDQMIAGAAKYKVKLAGIFQNRWNEANRALHDAVAEGRFGRIAWAGSFTPWYRTDQYYAEGEWRGTWKLDGGGAIMNQSVHAVDQLQWIVGPVKRVSAYAANRIHEKIEVEDTLTASLQFENGAFGTIVGTTAMWPGGGVRLWVGGENGSAVSENGLRVFKFRDERPGDKELRQRLNPDAAKNTGGGASATDIGLDMHGKNINAILRAWDEGRDAETWGPEARKAVAIIMALYESAKKGGVPVEVR